MEFYYIKWSTVLVVATYLLLVLLSIRFLEVVRAKWLQSSWPPKICISWRGGQPTATLPVNSSTHSSIAVSFDNIPSLPATMNQNSESNDKTGQGPSTDILEPCVLSISGQSVFDETAPSTPLYNMNSDIRSITNKDSSVELERVEHDEPRSDVDGVTADQPRPRHIFYLVHPLNAQYRDDIPARYYITSAESEMVGNIRLETSKGLFQRMAFKAMLSEKRTASDTPLFDEGTQQRLLFEIRPKWNTGGNRYRWCDSNGREVALEDREGGRHTLAVTVSMPRDLRDALVATWALKMWHDMAESKQAKREGESMPSPCERYCGLVVQLTSLSSS